MKAFIAGPLLVDAIRDTDFYERIALTCREQGLETFLPHLETEPFDKPADARQVFRQDYQALQQCDLLIAEVSQPSHGVGSELMQAFFQKIPIVCLCREDGELSRMVAGNPMVKEVILYSHKQDCLQKLVRAISRM